LEDTDATPNEILNLFGTEVLALVQEVTDDKSLPKQQRKNLQIENAPHKSTRAKQLKFADKSCNIYDLIYSPPPDWSLERCQEYVNWTEQVLTRVRGINPALEAHYDAVLAEARQKFT
jgi:(p)ppGpp synthase/HD superfamily hydrolase